MRPFCRTDEPAIIRAVCLCCTLLGFCWLMGIGEQEYRQVNPQKGRGVKHGRRDSLGGFLLFAKYVGISVTH